MLKCAECKVPNYDQMRQCRYCDKMVCGPCLKIDRDLPQMWKCYDCRNYMCQEHYDHRFWCYGCEEYYCFNYIPSECAGICDKCRRKLDE